MSRDRHQVCNVIEFGFCLSHPSVLPYCFPSPAFLKLFQMLLLPALFALYFYQHFNKRLSFPPSYHSDSISLSVVFPQFKTLTPCPQIGSYRVTLKLSERVLKDLSVSPLLGSKLINNSFVNNLLS